MKPIAADPETIKAGRKARLEAIFGALEQTGPASPMYLALREEFPERYEAIKEALLAELESDNPANDPEQSAMKLTRTSLAGIKDRVRQSSDESLRKVAAAQYALLTTLATSDPEACARYAAQGGDTTLPQTLEVSRALAGLAAVQIRAAGDATSAPQTRKSPAPELFAELVQRMKAGGITDVQISALAEDTLTSLPAADQCRVTISLYQSALGLSPVDAGVLLAAIIKN
ncbi:hypothetical protein [Sphingomonas sp. 3-13AW]|uniref:hypothetical protein n=1 Tax=Sphingomonas sp. 3-13AW TaxID=3050450 RepID=UPI003BB4F4A6